MDIELANTTRRAWSDSLGTRHTIPREYPVCMQASPYKYSVLYLFRHASCMDSEVTPHICLTPKNPALRRQYEEIGKMLLISEAACYRIGIAWLPPTAEVRRRISAYQGPIDEFLRLSLVGVNTQTLECYLSDLIASEPQDAEALCIPMPPPLDRYALAGLVFASILAASCLFGNILGYPLLQSITASTSISLVASLCTAAQASEALRRRSFAILLEQELNRRRGAGLSGTGMSLPGHIETKAISD